MTTTEEASRLHSAQIGARGEGHAIGHHGELIQGVFEDEQGRLHRGLVTIPLDGLRSTAQLILNESAILSVVPREKTKALRAAHLTLEQLGRAKAGGLLRIESNIPVGHGYGSSTADVVASIRAAAAALGTKLPPASISRLAVAAETASDATAFETEALLLRSGKGRLSNISAVHCRHSSLSASRQAELAVSARSSWLPRDTALRKSNCSVSCADWWPERSAIRIPVFLAGPRH